MELLSHEEVRSTFKTLRQRLKPTQRSGLTTLWEAVNEEGEYVKDPALRITVISTYVRRTDDILNYRTINLINIIFM